MGEGRSLSYPEAVDRLGRALAFGIHPSLDGIRGLCAELGSPEARLRAVQVTGTNGKTSVTRLVAGILHAHGARTGTYTSPHLTSYTERILIDGEPVSEEVFAAAVTAATDAADAIVCRGAEALGLPPDAVSATVTEFELITAAALWAFAHKDVEWAALEVGMGGRWDATSVVLPEVAVITGVALDHTERLGETRELIAEDKAQIIRPGATAVLGPGVAGVEDVILARAAAVDAPVVRVGLGDADVTWTVTEEPTRPGGLLRLQVRTPHAVYRELGLVAPAYQASNVALAVAAGEAALGRALDSGALAGALACVTFPGRFEVVREAPPQLVIDGAHNPEAAAVLAAAIAAAFADAPPVALIGVMADKDTGGVVRALAPAVAGFVATRSASPRALAPEGLAEVIRAEGATLLGAASDVPAGLARAEEMARERHTAVIACGSIYVAGEVRALLAGHGHAGAAPYGDAIESR